jgi:hypothetical protein
MGLATAALEWRKLASEIIILPGHVEEQLDWDLRRGRIQIRTSIQRRVLSDWIEVIQWTQVDHRRIIGELLILVSQRTVRAD